MLAGGGGQRPYLGARHIDGARKIHREGFAPFERAAPESDAEVGSLGVAAEERLGENDETSALLGGLRDQRDGVGDGLGRVVEDRLRLDDSGAESGG